MNEVMALCEFLFCRWLFYVFQTDRNHKYCNFMIVIAFLHVLFVNLTYIKKNKPFKTKGTTIYRLDFKDVKRDIYVCYLQSCSPTPRVLLQKIRIAHRLTKFLLHFMW